MKESNTVFRLGCARREHSYGGSGRGWDGTESGFDSEQSVVDSGTVEEVETTRAVTAVYEAGPTGYALYWEYTAAAVIVFQSPAASTHCLSNF